MLEDTKEESLYNTLYRDVIFGYSSFVHKDNTVYVKHISQTDFGYIEEFEEKYKKAAEKKGLPSEKEKVKQLIEEKVWSHEQEEQLKDKESQVENLEVTVSKLIIASQIKQTRKRIDKLESDLTKEKLERMELIGLTSESYASRKGNLEVLRWSIYKDKNLQELLFEELDFDYIEDQELNELLLKNNKIISGFRHNNLKRISASGFFLNSFLICDANVFTFYGKPVVELTNYQIEIFNHGLRFKSVLEKGKTPPSMLKTMQEIVDWYEGQLSDRNKGLENSKNKAGQTVTGATKEEMKQIMESSKEDGEEVAEFGEEAKKLMEKDGKKSLDFNDILKIHGEI